MGSKWLILQNTIGALCAAIILVSNNAVAFSLDSEETSPMHILNHSHPIRADFEENDLTDTLVICPLVTREDTVSPTAKDDLCETEWPELNFFLDKKEYLGAPKPVQEDIFIHSGHYRAEAGYSTHALPLIEFNPNLALIVFYDPNLALLVFHDPKKADKLFDGMIGFTIRW